MKEVTRDKANGITPTDFDAIIYSSIDACPFACCLKRKLTGRASYKPEVPLLTEIPCVIICVHLAGNQSDRREIKLTF